MVSDRRRRTFSSGASCAPLHSPALSPEKLMSARMRRRSNLTRRPRRESPASCELGALDRSNPRACSALPPRRLSRPHEYGHISNWRSDQSISSEGAAICIPLIGGRLPAIVVVHFLAGAQAIESVFAQLIPTIQCFPLSASCFLSIRLMD